ncbi:DUF1127 domain-containing protein [Acidisoma sp. C75]
MNAAIHTSSASRAPHGIAGRVARLSAPALRLGQWMREIGRRTAVINELDRLSDRELADIGLNRSEIRSIFSMSRSVQAR